MIQQSKSLKYEPSSEPLHISAKYLFLKQDRVGGGGEGGRVERGDGQGADDAQGQGAQLLLSSLELNDTQSL